MCIRDRHSLETFLGSIGLSTSPVSARHRVSGSQGADLPTPRPTHLPQVNQRLGWTTFLRHPFACLVPAGVARSTVTSEEAGGFRRLARTGVGRGVSSRVREYQPVVHRLRLSASLRSRLTLGGLACPRNPW